MFARVAAVGDAEAEVEVEALEQPSLEVVPLDHAEAVDGSVAHRELHTGGNKHSQRV